MGIGDCTVENMVSIDAELNCPVCDRRSRPFYRLARHNSTARRCDACSFVFLDPPLRESDGDYEAHYETPDYAERVVVDRAKFVRHLADVERAVLLPKLEGARVLEIGSSYGVLLGLLQSRGCNVEGLELLRGGVEASRKAGFTVHSVPLERFQPEHRYDIVISTHVLEHLRDVHAYFEKTAALLQPGGLSIILTPSADALLFRLLRQYWTGATPEEHNLFLSRQAAACLAERYGFEIVANKTTGRFWPLWRGVAAELARTLRSGNGGKQAGSRAPAPPSPRRNSGGMKATAYRIMNCIEFPFLYLLHATLTPFNISDELLVVMRKKP